MVTASRLATRAIFLLVAMGPAGFAAAQPAPDNTPPGYFYHGYDYGSDAAFNPASEVINGAFGILQISSRWVSLDQIDWRNGFDNTWSALSHPGAVIDAYGRSDFIRDELIPGRLDWNSLQYVPNYTLHMIGGGARHRAFIEWYRGHNIPAPVAWAWATTIAHAFAVEAVEHWNEPGPTVDPIADMYLFDPAGALLFSFDPVARFFSHTLNLSIWSGQPAYNPIANTIENAGQNYGLHFFLRDTHRVGLFMYWGMSHLFGVTVRGGSSFDWSAGLGGAVEELTEVERANGTTSLFARIEPDAGFFVHHNGSLLASIHISTAWTQRLRMQIYPGLVSVGGFATGLYTGVRDDDVIVGITFAKIPVGLALSPE
jgi:hypothetical protein